MCSILFLLDKFLMNRVYFAIILLEENMETLEEQIVLKPQVKLNNTERESGIELLRIIAIVFIVLYHSVALPVMTDSYYESVFRTLAYQNGKLGG